MTRFDFTGASRRALTEPATLAFIAQSVSRFAAGLAARVAPPADSGSSAPASDSSSAGPASDPSPGSDGTAADANPSGSASDGSSAGADSAAPPGHLGEFAAQLDAEIDGLHSDSISDETLDVFDDVLSSAEVAERGEFLACVSGRRAARQLWIGDVVLREPLDPAFLARCRAIADRERGEGRIFDSLALAADGVQVANASGGGADSPAPCAAAPMPDPAWFPDSELASAEADVTNMRRVLDTALRDLASAERGHFPAYFILAEARDDVEAYLLEPGDDLCDDDIEGLEAEHDDAQCSSAAIECTVAGPLAGAVRPDLTPDDLAVLAADFEANIAAMRACARGDGTRVLPDGTVVDPFEQLVYERALVLHREHVTVARRRVADLLDVRTALVERGIEAVVDVAPEAPEPIVPGYSVADLHESASLARAAASVPDPVPVNRAFAPERVAGLRSPMQRAVQK